MPSCVQPKVTSSIITGPPGGVETLRQCHKQGVALIASGASLGGLASQDWLYRSEPRDWKLNGVSAELIRVRVRGRGRGDGVAVGSGEEIASKQ